MICDFGFMFQDESSLNLGFAPVLNDLSIIKIESGCQIDHSGDI